MKKRKTGPKLKKFRVDSKTRLNFTQNLSVMLKAGVDLDEILSSFRTTAKAGKLKKAIDQTQTLIDEGYSFSRALKLSGLVSKQTLTLIELGEKSGNLSENLLVAAEQEEKQRKLRSKVRSAMIYPSFVMGMTLVIGLGVAWFLLPRLSDTFSRLDSDLPAISKIMLSAGMYLEANGKWFVPAFIITLALLVYIFFFAPGIGKYGKNLITYLPGISRLVREVEIARMGYLLGTLLKSGMSIVEALTLLEKATNSRRYAKLYGRLKDGFDNGYSFKASLLNYKKTNSLLPIEVQQIVIAGEKAGSLPDTLISIGESYESRSDVTAQNLQSIMEPVLLIIVWLGVLLVAVAIILPIYKLIGGLGG